MNKDLVMRAIANEMEYLYTKVLTNPKNEGKDLSKWIGEVKELYEAYFELRGHEGTIRFIQGMDVEANNVKDIYKAVLDIE